MISHCVKHTIQYTLYGRDQTASASVSKVICVVMVGLWPRYAFV